VTSVANPAAVQALSGSNAFVLNQTEYEALGVPVTPNWQLPPGSRVGAVKVAAAVPA
jgi:hypothetical protein